MKEFKVQQLMGDPLYSVFANEDELNKHFVQNLKYAKEFGPKEDAVSNGGMVEKTNSIEFFKKYTPNKYLLPGAGFVEAQISTAYRNPESTIPMFENIGSDKIQIPAIPNPDLKEQYAWQPKPNGYFVSLIGGDTESQKNKWAVLPGIQVDPGVTSLHLVNAMVRAFMSTTYPNGKDFSAKNNGALHCDNGAEATVVFVRRQENKIIITVGFIGDCSVYLLKIKPQQNNVKQDVVECVPLTWAHHVDGNNPVRKMWENVKYDYLQGFYKGILTRRYKHYCDVSFEDGVLVVDEKKFENGKALGNKQYFDLVTCHVSDFTEVVVDITDIDKFGLLTTTNGVVLTENTIKNGVGSALKAGCTPQDVVNQICNKSKISTHNVSVGYIRFDQQDIQNIPDGCAMIFDMVNGNGPRAWEFAQLCAQKLILGTINYANDIANEQENASKNKRENREEKGKTTSIGKINEIEEKKNIKVPKLVMECDFSNIKVSDSCIKTLLPSKEDSSKGVVLKIPDNTVKEKVIKAIENEYKVKENSPILPEWLTSFVGKYVTYSPRNKAETQKDMNLLEKLKQSGEEEQTLNGKGNKFLEKKKVNNRRYTVTNGVICKQLQSESGSSSTSVSKKPTATVTTEEEKLSLQEIQQKLFFNQQERERQQQKAKQKTDSTSMISLLFPASGSNDGN